MITVAIKRNDKGHINSFTMSGHAQYDDPGKDIVCAGASAVAFGAVNAIYKLCKIEPQLEQEESGFLHCDYAHSEDSISWEKVQLLLEGMLVSLQTIEQDYEEHMKIKQ